MKRFLTLMLVLLMAFMLIGCSSKEEVVNVNDDVAVENNYGVLESGKNDATEGNDTNLIDVPEGLKPIIGKELMLFMRYEGSPQCEDYSDFYAFKLEKMDNSYAVYQDWASDLSKYYDEDNWYVLHEYRPTYSKWMNWSDDNYNSGSNYNARVWILTSIENGVAYFDEVTIFGEYDAKNAEWFYGGRWSYAVELSAKNGYWYAEFLDMGYERIYGGLMEAKPIGKLTITADALNVRNKPAKDGDKLAVVDKWYGETFVTDKVEADGYTWYCIGPNWWIADDNGEWVDYKPF